MNNIGKKLNFFKNKLNNKNTKQYKTKNKN